MTNDIVPIRSVPAVDGGMADRTVPQWPKCTCPIHSIAARADCRVASAAQWAVPSPIEGYGTGELARRSHWNLGFGLPLARSLLKNIAILVNSLR